MASLLDLCQFESRFKRWGNVPAWVGHRRDKRTPLTVISPLKKQETMQGVFDRVQDRVGFETRYLVSYDETHFGPAALEAGSRSFRENS